MTHRVVIFGEVGNREEQRHAKNMVGTISATCGIYVEEWDPSTASRFIVTLVVLNDFHLQLYELAENRVF